MQRWKIWFVYIAIVPAILLTSLPGWGIAQEFGTIPADATAKSLDGKTVSVSDYKGKLVFLSMWKTDCFPCLLEIPILNQLQKEYASDDFTVIGVSLDRGKDPLVHRIVEKAGITYPVWFAYGQPIAKYVDFSVTPFLIVIGPDGRVLGHFLGKIPTYRDAVGFVDQAREMIAEHKEQK